MPNKVFMTIGDPFSRVESNGNARSGPCSPQDLPSIRCGALLQARYGSDFRYQEDDGTGIRMTTRARSPVTASRRQLLKYICSGIVLSFGGLLSCSADTNKVEGISKLHPDAGQLRVLTFNCWALPASFAKDQKRRVLAIGERLSAGEFDVVGLQEVWDTAAQTKIAHMAESGGLRYSHYFKNGISGSGNMILSRYPILTCDFQAYSVNGRPQRLLRDDYYGSKGVGMARIACPAGIIDFYVTHLISHYDQQDEYEAHRAAQIFELLQFIKRTNKSDFLIVAGDLNSAPESLEYSMLTALEKLNDAYREGHSDAGYTSSFADPGGPTERIDYVLYRERGVNHWSLTDSRLSMTFMKDSIHTFSDHFGVSATFSTNPEKRALSAKPVSRESDRKILETAMNVIDKGIADARSRESRHYLKAAGALATVPAGRFFAEYLKTNGHNRSLSRLLSLLSSYFMPLVTLVQFSLGLIFVRNEIDALKIVREGMSRALSEY